VRQEKSHPSWWQLYCIGLGIIGLLVVGALAHLSELGHELAAVGTLLLVWGLVDLWLRANTAALLHIGELILVPQPRPEAEVQTPDDEGQPGPIAQQQPQEADGPWTTEAALALQRRDGTTC
jgi:hypothetical protein